MDDEARAVSKRLRVAIGLQRAGISMMRQNFRRRHPEASEPQIDELLERWMRDRPGDAPGVPSRRLAD